MLADGDNVNQGLRQIRWIFINFLWVGHADISRGIHGLQSIRSLDNGQVGIDYKCHWVTN
jgi:hypothetical protein